MDGFSEGVVALAIGLSAGALLLTTLSAGKAGRIARLHVVLQNELYSSDWDAAELDVTELERLGGSWPAFSYQVRQTIAAGREYAQRAQGAPLGAGKRFDEATQSYVPDDA